MNLLKITRNVWRSPRFIPSNDADLKRNRVADIIYILLRTCIMLFLLTWARNGHNWAALIALLMYTRQFSTVALVLECCSNSIHSATAASLILNMFQLSKNTLWIWSMQKLQNLSFRNALSPVRETERTLRNEIKYLRKRKWGIRYGILRIVRIAFGGLFVWIFFRRFIRVFFWRFIVWIFLRRLILWISSARYILRHVSENNGPQRAEQKKDK